MDNEDESPNNFDMNYDDAEDIDDPMRYGDDASGTLTAKRHNRSRKEQWTNGQPDNSYLLNATLKSHLEEVEEFNADLQELIDNAVCVLEEQQDGAIKELKRAITSDFGKLKDQSRRARNAFKLEARRRLSEDVAEELIQDSIIQENIQLTQEATEIIKDIEAWIKERGLNLLQTSAGKETKIVWPTFTVIFVFTCVEMAM